MNMVNLRTKLGGMVLSLVVVFVAVGSASAHQPNKWRNRDRGLSNREKVGVIAGGAAAGALIGGLLKGKTGALVGGLIGGGAGTGYVLIKDRDNDDGWRGRFRNNQFRERGNRGADRIRDYDHYYNGDSVRHRDFDHRGYRGFNRRH